MTYMAKVQVGFSEAARKRLKDGYSWHKALWEAFPGQPDAKRDFLFRLDDKEEHLEVLMFSQQEPSIPEWGTWHLKQVAEGFINHDNYHFRLKANPTRRRASDRRRLAIYGEQELQKWLERKAKNHGFTVHNESLYIGAPIDEYFLKESKRGKLVSVDFRGMLTVQNRELFTKSFQKGIGSAKGLGFGLLLLKPIR